ncbi:glycosyltransferase family 2 protein [Parvularcula sp. LCG005]|uniref:glycosyltransferase family 2 protein n=1 Tax=Parvularcula sp. LCG005 TaxID=3078805 RepID=UPI00294287E0|nr:glycosyltransferase family 2 protein [Parvularcula sp. LCG005]WOI52793.1 glycosyltransferase family 2 protein [Parvularcula sp. LCG005]
MPVNVICMKWGTRYPAFYVNRLYAGVCRHLSRPFRFVCFTDDRTGLDPRIEALPLPDMTLPDSYRWTPWRKISVWQYPLAGLEGDCLFLDVDLVITGSLDEMFDHEPGKYCVIENWTQPGEGIGNTSVFRFRAGAYPQVYDGFVENPVRILSQHRIEQQYISTVIKDQTFWPRDWCLSFKHSIVPSFPLNWMKSPEPPPSAKVVVFTGRPDIDEALRGDWPAAWHKRYYKHARPARWIAQHWTHDEEGQLAPIPDPTDKPPISCFIRTKNEERLIGETVRAALQVAREVVIVDSGSTDSTVKIATKAGARVHNVEWRGTGKQKRAAEDLCKYPFRLDLDGDEVMTPALAESIRQVFATGEPTGQVFALKLVTAPPIGKPWYGLDTDYRNKLYDGRRWSMPDSEAWDQLDLPKDIHPKKLKGELIHYSFTDIGFLLRKQERNMTQRAKSAPLKPKWLLRLRIVFGLPLYFLKRYLLKGLFLKGAYGFSFCLTIAIGRWLKDVKMYERHYFGSTED